MISPVKEHNKHEALFLLQKANLPTEDISDRVALFALQQNGRMVGVIGLEHDGTIALLRSLSVNESQRGKGFGDMLVVFLENEARQTGIQTLYLLTTTTA